MQPYIHECLEGQLANGYKFFLKNQEKTKDFQMLRQIRTRITDHTQTYKQRLIWGIENNLQQSGLPNGVASSVVQDYTPNNHRSRVTNILIQLADN